MTRIEHRRAINIDELNERIEREVSAHPCWKAGRILGTMFLLHFGDEKIVQRRSGPFVVGAIGIQVRDVYWFIGKNGRTSFISDQMNRSHEAMLAETFLGRRLLRIDCGIYCSMNFSDGVTVRCDRTDMYDCEGEAIFILSFANGDITSFYANGVMELSWMAAESDP